MDLKYDVEADWILLNTCNYRCAYCFLSAADLGTKIRISGTPEQWVEGFSHAGKTWLLHITGGEPFIYPGFVDLCEQLARDHYLSINSNLSHRSVDDFAERIDPRRVHYINAALHPDERGKRREVDDFISRPAPKPWVSCAGFGRDDAGDRPRLLGDGRVPRVAGYLPPPESPAWQLPGEKLSRGLLGEGEGGHCRVPCGSAAETRTGHRQHG
jgi:Radical SAM superfamily